MSSKEGVYPVRSAYRILDRRTRIKEEQEVNDANFDITKFFKELWRTLVPFRFRYWGWQVANNSLPTSEVLQRHNHAQVSGECLNCDSVGIDTGLYLFRNC